MSVHAQFTNEQIDGFIQKGDKQELIEKSTFTLLDNYFYQSTLLVNKLLELEPDNANFNYRKGYSLLMSNSDFTLSKPFLEKAVVKISKNYDIFSSKETGAPVDTYYHLGKSYHLNNDLEKAKSFYNKYLSDAPKKTELGNRAKLNLMQLENATIMIGQPLEDYFASTENLKGKVKISITEVVFAGPEYTNRDYRDVNKYLPFQYVGARIDGINSMGGQPELLQSKDSELLVGQTEISSQATTSSIDKNGNEFSTGNMIESNYTFNIVAGVFSRIHYAEAYVENLKKKGFDAKIIGKINGLHVVSAGSSNSLSEARVLLEKVSAEVAQTAWILNSNKN